jgi:hypothetical protein
MTFDDFKPKFKWQLDRTFWLHLLREFILTLIVGARGALCFNFAWEWQDGLHNDGFNLADFLAGLIGILLAQFVRSKLWQLL